MKNCSECEFRFAEKKDGVIQKYLCSHSFPGDEKVIEECKARKWPVITCDLPDWCPLRTKDYNAISVAPPLGIEPRYIWKGKRRDALAGAVYRYLADHLKIPTEWVEEYNELVIDTARRDA